MKHLITNNISGSARMPVKSGTLNHIQSAYIEVFYLLGLWLTDAGINWNKVHVLYGAELSLSGSTYTITDGLAYYQGHFYQVVWATFPSGSGVPVLVIDEQYETGPEYDPVTFTDSSTHNVHMKKYIKAQMGPSGGSGVANYIHDYTGLIRLCPPTTRVQNGLTWGTSQTMKFDRNYSLFYASASSTTMNLFFDLTNAAVGATTRMQVTFAAGTTLNVIPPLTGYVFYETGSLVGAGGSNKQIYATYYGFNGSFHEIGIKVY